MRHPGQAFPDPSFLTFPHFTCNPKAKHHHGKEAARKAAYNTTATAAAI